MAQLSDPVPRDGSFSFKKKPIYENDDEKSKNETSVLNGNRFKKGRFQKQSFLKS